jgi:signal transduction histidine kinase
MLGDATRAAERTRSIIETFRSFARDTRSAERVDLNACLEETIRVVERQLPHEVRLLKRLGRIPRVPCFRGQMNQVFFNLIQNAVEAIEGKGTIQVRSRKAKGAVAIEVTDSGRGMSPEVQARLFEPFFTTKPVGKGLGLGLSISAMIVQNHGGTISLTSQVGTGTTFRVVLPTSAPARKSAPDP